MKFKLFGIIWDFTILFSMLWVFMGCMILGWFFWMLSAPWWLNLSMGIYAAIHISTQDSVYKILSDGVDAISDEKNGRDQQ